MKTLGGFIPLIVDKRKQGKKNRASGKRHELKVRADLEKQGWLVFRNSNDVTPVEETDIGEYERFFQQAKTKWNFFTKRPMGLSPGFPDFLCLRFNHPVNNVRNSWEVKFIEAKINGYLDKEEREKVEWIKAKLHIPVIVASKGLKRGEILYTQK